MFHAVAREQIPYDGNLRQPGPPVQRLRIGSLDEAAEDISLAISQSNIVLNYPLPDNRLADSADGGWACNGRNFDLYLQADVVIRMHARSHVNIHANVLILELR